MKSLSPSVVVIFLIAILSLAIGQPLAAVQTDPSPKAEEQSDDLPIEWIDVEPEGARASFKMPATPKHTERILPAVEDKAPITLQMYRTTAEKGTMSFFFGYHDFPKKPESTEVVNILDHFIRDSIGNVRGVLAKEPVVTDKKMGRTYLFVYSHYDKRYIVNSRLLLVGRRLYQYRVIMEENVFDKAIGDRFLRSVKTHKPESDLPPRPPELKSKKDDK